jgi:hypothetical protein
MPLLTLVQLKVDHAKDVMILPRTDRRPVPRDGSRNGTPLSAGTTPIMSKASLDRSKEIVMTYQRENMPPSPAWPPTDDDGRSEVAKQEATQVTDTLKEQKDAVAGRLQAGGQHVTAETKEQAGRLVEEAQGQFMELLDRSQSELTERASEQTDKAAAGLRSLSEQLAALVDGRPDDAGDVVGYVREVADQAERYAGRLEGDGFSAVASDLSRFARRRPGVFLLAAVAAGFAAGRLVKGARKVNETNGADHESALPATSTVRASGPVPSPAAGSETEFELSGPGVWDDGGNLDPLAEVLPPTYLAGAAERPREV